MVDFAVHAARLSAEVDNRLGDLIQYAAGAGAAFVEMKGRVFVADASTGLDPIDEAENRWRLRIAKGKVPAPSKADRIKCSTILGNVTYRPVAKDPISDGRYWLVDLQKV